LSDLLCTVYRQPMHPLDAQLDSIDGLRDVLGRLKTLVFFAGGGGSPLRTYGVLLETLALRVVHSVHTHGRLRTDERRRLDAVLADAYETHRRARDERLRREAEAASLFRSKTTVEQTDEELLAELFPGYEDVLEPSDEHESREPSFDDIPEHTVAVLAACHQHVMLQYAGPLHRPAALGDQHAQLVEDVQRRAYDLAAQLYALRPELAQMHGASLDASLRAAHAVALARAVHPAPAHVAGVGMTEAYDFYRDARPSEILLVQPLAQSIIERVRFLAEEWPDHAVLQQIEHMCQRLLELPADTPVAKMLAAVELLHQRAQDWQAFASREV
ncbi:AAA ATPase midasin, partial [Coemansia sp. RSA 2703]